MEIESLLVLRRKSVQLKSEELIVLLGGVIKHLWLRFPLNSCKPVKAKTLRQKTVRIITSDSFFTDWNKAPTMVFSPGQYRINSQSKLSGKVDQQY